MTHYTPNLPALITALPGAHTRAPQTEFTRARQVLFLENLSVTGSVSSAAAAGGVSRQSAYRARRATPALRTAWDAALVVARAAAADTLAARAIDGIEEKVFYHGEEVATRTRFSDRLLLAHLARLDKLAETPAANAFAEDFDAALARFASGEENEAPASAGGQTGASAGYSEAPEKTSPGPCNTRSMSHNNGESEDAFIDDETYDEDEHDEDGIDWEDDTAAEAELNRIEAEMKAQRPADAPRLTGDGADDPHGLIGDAQHQAFVAGVPRWWLVVPPAPEGEGEAWRYAEAGAGIADRPPALTKAERKTGAPRQDAEPEPEVEPEQERVPVDEPEHEAAPAVQRGGGAEAAPAVEPEPAPEPRQHAEALDRRWSPINDGRMQPFYGR